MQTKRRGRPPKDGAAMAGAERQRRYMERLLTAKAAAPAPSLTDHLGRDPLQAALDQIAFLKADRDRWQADCTKAEAELKREEQRHLNTTKDKITLQKEIAALKAKPKREKR